MDVGFVLLSQGMSRGHEPYSDVHTVLMPFSSGECLRTQPRNSATLVWKPVGRLQLVGGAFQSIVSQIRLLHKELAGMQVWFCGTFWAYSSGMEEHGTPLRYRDEGGLGQCRRFQC